MLTCVFLAPVWPGLPAVVCHTSTAPGIVSTFSPWQLSILLFFITAAAPTPPCAGSAYNQDGRSSGLTAPNGPAQTTLVRTATAVAGALPHHVGLVSMHGTGGWVGTLSLRGQSLRWQVAAQRSTTGRGK